ncbi:hypothetical protein DXG01_002339 [Tephrocybe rancida]|nr:hypothetical protein DXG01_002339 [Tephrocybe rancida]
MGNKKKSDAEKENQPDTSGTCCIWTDADDEIMVCVLRLQKDGGNQSGAGWKKQVWTIVAAALEKEGVKKGAEKTSSKCSDHWSNLKKNFNEVALVHHASGFGWDDVTKKCVTTDAVWAPFIKAHKKLERWRDTPFLLYDQLEYLVNGVVATGAAAFHPGESPAATESIPWSDSEQGSPIPFTESILTSSSQQTMTTASSILNDELTAELETPALSRKRTHAETSSPSPEKPASAKHSRNKGRHSTNAESMADVASTIKGLSAVMQAPPTTPEHCKAALDLVKEDEEYSKNEQLATSM